MNNDFAKLGNYLNKSKDVLILLPEQPSADATAAGLSFYLSLKESGKQAIVASALPISVGLNRLVAVDKITDRIGSRNLVVSFDYVQDSIEKVSYNITQGKFNLVIEPKANFPPLDPDKVSYSYTGAVSDFVVVIGAQRLEDLGQLYEKEKKIFIDKETLNIDVDFNNTLFGKTNLVVPQASSCSEVVGIFIKNYNLPVNADIATNLVAGIESATNNFTRKTRAETFEILAWCLRNGGRRGQLAATPPSQPFDARPFMSPQTTSIAAPAWQGRPAGIPPQRFAAGQSPSSQPFIRQPLPPAPAASPQPTPSWSPPPSPPPNFPNFEEKPSATKPPSPDWLKPKIYKGNTPVK